MGPAGEMVGGGGELLMVTTTGAELAELQLWLMVFTV
jgi:hypothetical protein